jgi:hypothetical protein
MVWYNPTLINTTITTRIYTYGIIGNRRRGVEHAVAAGDGVAQRVAVEQVGPAQRQPLRRAGEAPQVRVLRVICAQRTIHIKLDR